MFLLHIYYSCYIECGIYSCQMTLNKYIEDISLSSDIRYTITKIYLDKDPIQIK
jgi:hypothetical protein